VLAALALREQQQVCLQRVRYELERVRQLIDMVRKKEKVKWQVGCGAREASILWGQCAGYAATTTCIAEGQCARCSKVLA
jgi:hypothetical protein